MIRKISSTAKAAFIVGSAILLTTMTGCIGHEDGHSHGRVYAPVVVVQDDYIYYPGYQVYYSNQRHHYVYLEGRTWVSRPAPPRVSVDVLFASPSVRLDFHDSPSRHHTTIVQKYPKQWVPPGSGPGHGPGKNKDGKGHD